jgi:V8-like Glu-specific endopeptidase
MRTCLLILLALVSGCSRAQPVEFREYAVRLGLEGHGVCSGTAVGRNIILTAQHCLDAGRIVAIDGQAAYALEVVKDGKDHALVRVTTTFKRWARMGVAPSMGDRIRWVGNPAGVEKVYRQGYVARVFTDEILIDAAAFGGDSGSGLMDDKGRVVAVLTGAKWWRDNNGMTFALVLAFPLAFTEKDWAEIRA